MPDVQIDYVTKPVSLQKQNPGYSWMSAGSAAPCDGTSALISSFTLIRSSPEDSVTADKYQY